MQNKSEKDRRNYQLLVEEKEFTNKMFMKDQERSGQNGFFCCYFDLEKVLNSPWVIACCYFTQRNWLTII